MENQKRGVGTSHEGIPPLKKKPHREKRFTVMIMGNLGRVRSFEVSPRIVFWTALFLILYIPLSVFFINRYFVLRSAHNNQATALNLLEKEATKDQKALLRSKEHIAFLEEYIDSLERDQEKESQPARKETSETAASSMVAVNTTKAEQPLSQNAGIVSIENMVITKDNSRIEVEFRLVNTQQGEEAVGGYVHIIARAEGDNPKLWTFPYERLVNGLPENYRRGQLFLIKWFKPVQGRFDLPPHSDPPSSIKILVYDQSGILILEDEFEVKNET